DRHWDPSPRAAPVGSGAGRAVSRRRARRAVQQLPVARRPIHPEVASRVHVVFRQRLLMPAVRFNAFQRIMRLWDTLHPYNAAQVMKLAGAPDVERLRDAWARTLATLGL